MASSRACAEEVTEPERRLRVFRTRGSDPPSPDSHLFRAEISDVVTVGLNAARDRLVIEHWNETRGLRRTERR